MCLKGKDSSSDSSFPIFNDGLWRCEDILSSINWTKNQCSVNILPIICHGRGSALRIFCLIRLLPWACLFMMAHYLIQVQLTCQKGVWNWMFVLGNGGDVFWCMSSRCCMQFLELRAKFVRSVTTHVPLTVGREHIAAENHATMSLSFFAFPLFCVSYLLPLVPFLAFIWDGSC